MDWAKIKEKLQERIVTVVLSLASFLCLVIWQAVPSESWARLGAAIPKRVLAAVIGLLLIALSTALAYILSLRKKLKSALTPVVVETLTPVDSSPKKEVWRGVVLDAEGNLYCPACDILLHKLPRKEDWKLTYSAYQCPKCRFLYEFDS